MKYTSETIQKIITSDAALYALENISPIYAEAENFLELLNVIGTQLDVIIGYGDGLKVEAVPQTADKLIKFWEWEYGLKSDETLTLEQRRALMRAKIRLRPPMNPAKMTENISAAAGVESYIVENSGKNTFTVWLIAAGASSLISGIKPVNDIINTSKPAHLIYEIKYEQPVVCNLYIGGLVQVGKMVTIWEVG